MKYNQVGLCLFSGRCRPDQMREGVHLSLRNQRTPSTRGGLDQQRIFFLNLMGAHLGQGICLIA